MIDERYVTLPEGNPSCRECKGRGVGFLVFRGGSLRLFQEQCKHELIDVKGRRTGVYCPPENLELRSGKSGELIWSTANPAAYATWEFQQRNNRLQKLQILLEVQSNFVHSAKLLRCIKWLLAGTLVEWRKPEIIGQDAVLADIVWRNGGRTAVVWEVSESRGTCELQFPNRRIWVQCDEVFAIEGASES